MKRRPFFLAAPGDALALEAEAEVMLDRLLPCSAKQLVLAAGSQRHDLALALLYRACFRGPNGDFLRQLSGLPSGVAPLNKAVRVVVVPGLNFRQHPEMGADGRLLADVARRLGAKAEILEINPRGAVSANGAMIADRLAQLNDEPVWLISVSKGSADLRAAYSLMGHWPKGVSGWINLSGIFQGTPLADRVTQSALRRWLNRILLTLGGAVFDKIEELRTDAPLWRLPVEPPSPERMVHVLGFPPSWSIEMRFARHYLRLRESFGPNDGLTPLTDCFDYPGRIFPVWGADHFMRIPDLAALIYRLFHFISAVESKFFENGASRQIHPEVRVSRPNDYSEMTFAQSDIAKPTIETGCI